MSEIINRAAKALVEQITVSCGSDRCCCSGYERWECMLGKNPEDIARIVIEAMREPTDAMKAAGDEMLPEHKGFEDDAAGAYRVMLDAALK